MTRTTYVGVLAVVAAGLLGAGWLTRAAEAQAPPGGGTAPGGKAVLVLGKNQNATLQNATLQSVEVRQIGGRSFLVGHIVANSAFSRDRDLAGRKLWFAVDEIEGVVEFDSLDQVQEKAAGK